VDSRNASTVGGGFRANGAPMIIHMSYSCDLPSTVCAMQHQIETVTVAPDAPGDLRALIYESMREYENRLGRTPRTGLAVAYEERPVLFARRDIAEAFRTVGHVAIASAVTSGLLADFLGIDVVNFCEPTPLYVRIF
jgi:hypothetical protein